MKANKINGVIKLFSEIPNKHELKPNVFNYHLQDESVHYADGYRDYISAEITDLQKKEGYIFDSENDVYTDNVINKTEEEIAQDLANANAIPLQNEYEKYKKRQRDGVDAYMMISAEFRLMKLGGAISEETHNEIEELLTPIRNEVIAGQWKKGLELLIVLGSGVIGLELYDRLYSQLNDYITLNY
jgi:hypothetical protein